MFCVVTTVRRFAARRICTPELVRFSARKGLDGSDEPRCVLEQEGVAGIGRAHNSRPHFGCTSAICRLQVTRPDVTGRLACAPRQVLAIGERAEGLIFLAAGGRRLGRPSQLMIFARLSWARVGRAALPGRSLRA